VIRILRAKRSVLLPHTHSPPLLNALPRSCTLCRKTLRTTPATIQIMPTISPKIPATSAVWTLNYACFEKEIQVNVRRIKYVNRFSSHPRSPPSLPTFFSRAFSSAVFASRLTYNPVLWFPSQGPSRFALSAEKASLTFCRRDRPDGTALPKFPLTRSRQRLGLRQGTWPLLWPSTNQTRSNQSVVKTTVHRCRHLKQKASSTPPRQQDPNSSCGHEPHSRHRRTRPSKTSKKDVFRYNHPP
jgi:hypothetical protein